MELDNKKVFIVTPIGGENTEIRRATDGVIDAVIIPSLIDIGFNEDNISVAHRISNSGSINKQIITRIIEDDLVIANLTKLNPNVMYELATRHAIRKPVVQICEDGTTLPFDIVDERTIFYTNDMKGVLDLSTSIKKHVKEAIKADKPDNPIYRAIQTEIIIKQSEPSEVDFKEYLINRLDTIESQMNNNNRRDEKIFRKTNQGYTYMFSIATVADIPFSKIMEIFHRCLDTLSYDMKYSLSNQSTITRKGIPLFRILLESSESLNNKQIKSIVEITEEIGKEYNIKVKLLQTEITMF